MDNADIADYVATNLKDAISRISGVGDSVAVLGRSIRHAHLAGSHKLQSYKLMPSDVINAINAQNAQVSAGQLGGTPSVPGQQMNLAISVQERLQTPEQFGNVILRTNPDGSLIRVKDVARVELGSESYSTLSRYNGKPATGIAVKLATGANALETASNIDDYLKGAEAFFPQGLKAVYPFDTTPVVKISIHEVVKTLGEAVLLVFLVMYLFLQNFRATLIPTIAVPVVLLGTFGVLSAFGYSINTLTMFAVVLAIGLLVDDAIVVVENVERVMSEDKLSPKEAARKSMDQITGALVGIAMVLSAVFIPMAFFGGSVGVIYRQFSVTIVSAMVLSVVVAIVLDPGPLRHDAETHRRGSRAFAARLLRLVQPLVRQRHAALPVRRVLRHPARGPLHAHLSGAYRRPGLHVQDPAHGLPARRRPGYAVRPDRAAYRRDAGRDHQGAGAGRTLLPRRGKGIHRQSDGRSRVQLRGQRPEHGYGLRAPQGLERASGPVPQGGRRVQARHGGVLENPAMRRCSHWRRPPLLELGNATGFDFQLQDSKSGLGHEALLQARNQLLGMAAQNKNLVAVRPNGQEDQPQLRVDIDRAEKARARSA